MIETMHKWYVVQVMSGQEKKVKRGLDEFLEPKAVNEHISEILLPTENVYEMKKGEKKIVEKRIWPGYLLIKMDLNDKTWDYVKNSNGVIGFLGGSEPTALSDTEVGEILSDLAEKKETVSEKHKFEVGDHVKVNDGVFVNFIGTITDIFHDKGRLSVTLSIFGRETRVDDLEFWQVEEVSDDDLS